MAAALSALATSCVLFVDDHGDLSLACDADGATDCGAAATGSGRPEAGGPEAGGPDGVTTVDGSGGGGILCNTLGASGCVCQGQASGNAAACSAVTLGVDPASVVCCADATYPSAGTACTCQWFGCSNNGGACVCGNGLGSPGGACGGGTSTCCRQTGGLTCVCSTAACVSGFVPMGSSCTVQDLKCASNQRQVTACK
jgi:hypothetical protein